MKLGLMFLIALSAALCSASDIDRVRLIQLIDDLKLSTSQYPALKATADAHLAARDQFGKRMGSVPAMPGIVEALAIGRTLTATEAEELAQAQGLKRFAEEQFERDTVSIVRAFLPKLTQEQKRALSTPFHVHNSLTAALKEIKESSDEEWPEVRERLVGILVNREFKQIRNGYSSRESGRTEEQIQKERGNRSRSAMMEATKLLDGVRSGNAQAVRDFPRLYIENSVNDTDAGIILQSRIRDIVTHGDASASIELMIKHRRSRD